MKKGLNGFEIIAVTILIIIILLVVPPIISHYGHDRHTIMLQTKSRMIWLAIMSANAEREILGQPSLLPGDLANQGITFSNAETYFTYLMSDGTNTQVIATNRNDRLVYDLDPPTLRDGAMPMANAEAPVLPQNNMWHVVNVTTNSSAQTPFLVTRNVKASAIAYPTPLELENKKGVPLPIDDKVVPFKSKLIFAVNLGGTAISMSSKKITRPRLCPIPQPQGAPELTVLPARDGYQ